eukprot:81493-Pleurochrysis_carterae.AAC.1
MVKTKSAGLPEPLSGVFSLPRVCFRVACRHGQGQPRGARAWIKSTQSLCGHGGVEHNSHEGHVARARDSSVDAGEPRAKTELRARGSLSQVRDSGGRKSGGRESGGREPGGRKSGGREPGGRESGMRESGGRESAGANPARRECGYGECGGRGRRGRPCGRSGAPRG